MKKLILLLVIVSAFNLSHAQWETKNYTLQGFNSLEVIRFYDDSLGLAMGTNSSVLRTVNQGEDWETIPLPFTLTISDAQFVSEDTVFAVGYYRPSTTEPPQSTFIRSFDSGLTWDSINTLEGKQLLSMHFFNASSGLLSGFDGIYKTTDGGVSWDTVYSLANRGFYALEVNNISFIDEQTGYASLFGLYQLSHDPPRENLVLKTSDGGVTWDSIAAFDNSIYSVEFFNENIGYISEPSKVYKTSDGGITWVEVVSNLGLYDNVMNDIQLINEEVAVLVGHPLSVPVSGSDDGFSILKTINGGASWDIIDTIGLPLRSVHFVNDSVGFVSGWRDLIMKTNSCGGPIGDDYPWPIPNSTYSLEKEFDLLLYPNPTNDYLNIYFYHPAMKGEAHFSLQEASGKIVKQFSSGMGDVTHLWQVDDLAAGVYWLTCRVGDSVLTREVVIVR